jgi:hypothetical protein
MRAIVNASPTSTLLIARRAKVLLPALYDWGKDWIKEAIEKPDLQLSYEDFHQIAEKAAEREPKACRKLRDFAKVLFPHLPKARGQPLSTATVTHAVLLALAHHGPRARSRTYCPILGDFVDPLTKATRLQFDAPQFSPSRAAELVEKHRLTED